MAGVSASEIARFSPAMARCVIGLVCIAATVPELLLRLTQLLVRWIPDVLHTMGFPLEIPGSAFAGTTGFTSSLLWQVTSQALLPLLGATLLWHPIGARVFGRVVRRLNRENAR